MFRRQSLRHVERIVLGTFLLRQAFLSLPHKVMDAAKVDGAGHMRTLWSIVVPIAHPSIITFALLSLVAKWNNFLWPLLVTNTERMRVLPIGIYRLLDQEGTTQWGTIMAGTIFVVLPVLLVFLWAQRYIIEGIAAGAAAAIMSTGSMGGLLRDAQFPLGTAFLPKKEQFGCCTGGAGMAILASLPEEKQQAAMRWIAFATNPENTTFWLKNTGYMPVRTSAVESDEMQQYFEENPTFKTAVDQLPQTKPQDAARVFMPGGDQIIGKGLEQIVVSKQDPAAAFEQVNNQLTQAAQPVIQSLKQVEV